MDKNEVIEKLCQLQRTVSEHIGWQHAADCFCHQSNQHPPGSYFARYQNDGTALAFIVAAVQAQIDRQKAPKRRKKSGPSDVTPEDRLRSQQRWIERCGGDLAGYIETYGSANHPDKMHGDGGEAIYEADMAMLRILEKDVLDAATRRSDEYQPRRIRRS